MSDNKDMRPSGTPQQLEQRRRKAIALLEQGHRNQEVARLVGASPGTICDWKKAYQKLGESFFEAHSPPGRKCGLSEKQMSRLKTLLLKGPGKHGYRTELWTLQRIAEVIEKHFGIAYDPSSVWHILHRMGWSCQKPESKAREQNPEAVVQWRQTDWPRIKKRPKNG
jgi:transposase